MITWLQFKRTYDISVYSALHRMVLFILMVGLVLWEGFKNCQRWKSVHLFRARYGSFKMCQNRNSKEIDKLLMLDMTVIVQAVKTEKYL